MKKLLIVAAASMIAASAALAQTAAFTPAQAIAGAAEKQDLGFPGTFEFVVKSSGESRHPQGVVLFLSSENDYRSPENLSIMIMPATINDLTKQLGGPAKEKLVGKRVAVTGTAKPVRIDMVDDDRKPVGKYYFQTRVIVKSADQIKLLDASAAS